MINFFTNWQELEPRCAKCCVKIKVNRGNKWFTEACDKSRFGFLFKNRLSILTLYPDS